MKESGQRHRADRRSRDRTPPPFSVLAGSGATFYAALCVGRLGRHSRAGRPRSRRRASRLFDADRRRAARRSARAAAAARLPLARLLGRPTGVAGLKAALEADRVRRRRAAAAARPVADAGSRRFDEALARFEEVRGMSLLPDTDRILLGPGPSLTAPRVMRAMASPTVSHLDPLMMALLDDVRARLGRMFRAPDGFVRVRGVGHRHLGHGNGRRESGAARHARARRRHRLLRRSARADVRAVRRDRHAARRRVGTRLRSRRAAPRARRSRRPTSWRWCTPRRRPACSIRSSNWRRSRASTAR